MAAVVAGMAPGRNVVRPNSVLSHMHVYSVCGFVISYTYDIVYLCI